MFTFDEVGWGMAWFSLLAGVALKSLAIFGVAWCVAWLMRGRPAAARHVVWTAAAAALIALPLLSIVLPAMRVPLSRALPPLLFVDQVRATAGGGARPVVAPQTRPFQPAAQTRGIVFDWRLALMLLWAAGTSIGLARMAAGWIAVWRLRAKSTPIQDEALPELAALLGIVEEVRLYEGPPGAMPMTFGFFHPAILLPAEASHWAGERRRMVLLHEFAHVRRGDLAAHQIARLALALYWWNPLAWIASREFLKERERAADDLVLASGLRATGYAATLLDIARSMRTPSVAASAALAIARPSQLEDRLIAILDSKVSRQPIGRRFALTATLIGSLLVAPLAALRAQDEDAKATPPDVAAVIRMATSQKNYGLLDDTAKAAQAQRQYGIARELLAASLEIRAQVAGKQSDVYAAGLVKLGELEQRLGNSAQAASFYSQAVEVLGERPEAARALVGLGTNALIAKDPDRALEYFEKAQLADPAHSGPAKMWTAVVRQQQQSLGEAEELYRSALTLEAQDGASASITAALLGKMLQNLGREDEARTLLDQATAMRAKLGAEAAAARKTPASHAYKIGGDVKAPALVSKVEPEYSDEARVAKYDGTVVLTVVVGEDGMAHNMNIVRGLGLGLDEKAMDAIAQWKFKPATKDGQPVAVQATIEVNFRLL